MGGTLSKVERHIPRTNIFFVIISELRHGQEPRPVVLFVVNKGSKVNFYHADLPLSLAVGLEMESSQKHSFDAQEVVQRGLELRRKYYATAADNKVR